MLSTLEHNLSRSVRASTANPLEALSWLQREECWVAIEAREVDDSSTGIGKEVRCIVDELLMCSSDKRSERQI